MRRTSKFLRALPLLAALLAGCEASPVEVEIVRYRTIREEEEPEIEVFLQKSSPMDTVGLAGGAAGGETSRRETAH